MPLFPPASVRLDTFAVVPSPSPPSSSSLTPAPLFSGTGRGRGKEFCEGWLAAVEACVWGSGGELLPTPERLAAVVPGPLIDPVAAPVPTLRLFTRCVDGGAPCRGGVAVRAMPPEGMFSGGAPG